MTVDFKAVKESVAIGHVISWLGLEGKWHTSDQWRGPCPICKTGGDRALVVTKSKSAFYCWGMKKGGDAIYLTSHIKDCSQTDAAKMLQEHFADAGKKAVSSPTSSQGAKSGFDAAGYAQKLDPAHASLEPLGIDPEVLRERQGGYAASGALRGTLALPVTREAKTVAFFGRAITGSPTLKFVNGFEPHDFIFGEDRVTDGTLTLCKDVLDVIRAQDAGLNAVCFLTETVTQVQLQILAALMDEKKCHELEIL